MYTIKSIKTADETRATLTAAIERAQAILAEYQPAYGVQVEDADGETVWDSEEPTVTDAQIKALRGEAAEAGDVAQRILCDIALDGEDSLYDEECLDADGRPDYSGGGHSRGELRAIEEALRMTQDEARAECARVIAEAQAVRS